MELEYLKVMAEYNLSDRELPEDAKNAISTIKSTIRLAKVREKKGEDASKYYEKAKSFDNFVVKEIFELINSQGEEEEGEEKKDGLTQYQKLHQSYDSEGDDNEEEDGENVRKKDYKPNGDGAVINKELHELFKNGKIDLTINEIKTQAPNSYETIFDCYEDDGENGIMTSEFSLIEYEKQKYKLTKK